MDSEEINRRIDATVTGLNWTLFVLPKVCGHKNFLFFSFPTFHLFLETSIFSRSFDRIFAEKDKKKRKRKRTNLKIWSRKIISYFSNRTRANSCSILLENGIIGESILQRDSLIYRRVPEAGPVDYRQFRCSRFPLGIVESWLAHRVKIDNDCIPPRYDELVFLAVSTRFLVRSRDLMDLGGRFVKTRKKRIS